MNLKNRKYTRNVKLVQADIYRKYEEGFLSEIKISTQRKVSCKYWIPIQQIPSFGEVKELKSK